MPDRLVSVVIPCFESEHYLEDTVKEIFQVFRAHPEFSLQLILINDGSEDATFTVIRKLCETDLPGLQIIGIDLERNYGQGAAKMAGIPYIRGSYAVFMDDDGQHDPEVIPLLLRKIDDGYDLVYAQFRQMRESLWRRIASKAHDRMLGIFTGKPKGLTITSFFALSTRAIDYLKTRDDFAGSIGMTLFPVTGKVTGVPIEHRQRTEGTSNYTLHKLFAEWSRIVHGSKKTIPKDLCRFREILNCPDER